MTENSSKFQGNTKVTPTQPTTHLDPMPKCKVIHFYIFKMKELVWRNILIPPKWSLTKEQLQGVPLTKQDILDIYSDVFTGIRKFPVLPTNSS